MRASRLLCVQQVILHGEQAEVSRTYHHYTNVLTLGVGVTGAHTTRPMSVVFAVRRALGHITSNATWRLTGMEPFPAP